MRQRSTLVSSLVLLSGLAAGSYWLAERARLHDPIGHQPGHTIDYYVENFTLTRMDDEGNALYDVASRRMTHYQDDDSTTLVAPQISSVRPDKPVVHMQSLRGVVTSDGVQVTLTGDVQLTRAATPDNPELKGFGSELVVFPERDIAHSDQPFEVVQAGSHVWADNMEFDNTERTIQMNVGIQARGHSVFEPLRPKGAPAAAGKDKS